MTHAHLLTRAQVEGTTGTLRLAFSASRLLAAVDINEGNHRAINSVVGCEIRPDVERVGAAF